MSSDGSSSPNHAFDNGPKTNSSGVFTGLGNTEALLLNFSSSVVLTGIKIAQEVHAWRARDEERRVLGKLWDKMSARSRSNSRPAALDSRMD